MQRNLDEQRERMYASSHMLVQSCYAPTVSPSCGQGLETQSRVYPVSYLSHPDICLAGGWNLEPELDIELGLTNAEYKPPC